MQVQTIITPKTIESLRAIELENQAANELLKVCAAELEATLSAKQTDQLLTTISFEFSE